MTLWFGDTPIGKLKKQFEVLLDHMACRMNNGLDKVKLQYNETTDEANQGIAHVKVKGGNTDTIWFSAGFFSDDKVVPLMGLLGAPLPKDEHVKQTLDAARHQAELRDELHMWNRINSWVQMATRGEMTLHEAIAEKFEVMSKRSLGGPKPVLQDWLDLCERAKLKLDGPCSTARQIAPVRQDALKRQIDAQDHAGLGINHGFKISSAGVVLHEMTHLVLRTEDVERQEFVGKEKRSYGPVRCAALASMSPAEAFNNADSYRLFAESCVVA